jgi:hypothetical protein
MAVRLAIDLSQQASVIDSWLTASEGGQHELNPTVDEVIQCATEACRCFADFSDAFFNFEKRSSWLGWENWLTVEVARRLKSRNVLPFYSYPRTGERLDLFVSGPIHIAVEIKTNYITDREAKQNPRPMPSRVLADATKIKRLDTSIRKLLLVSTFFESQTGLSAYPECVAHDLKARFGQFEPKWSDCSSGSGHVLLLALRARVGDARGGRRRIRRSS